MDWQDQARIVHILLGQGEANITLLRGEQKEIESIQEIFNTATWLIYKDKDLLFLPSPSDTSDGYILIQGKYFEIFNQFQIQGEQLLSLSSYASIDGFLVLEDDTASLDILYLAQTTQTAVKVTQSLRKAHTLPDYAVAQLANVQKMYAAAIGVEVPLLAQSVVKEQQPSSSALSEGDSPEMSFLPPDTRFDQKEGGSFHGTWVTEDFGEMRLTQSGDQVIGQYTGRGGGRITGSTRNNRLEFGWQDTQDSEENFGMGFLRAVMGEKMLVGAWLRAQDKEPKLTRFLIADLLTHEAPTMEELIPLPEHTKLKFEGFELVHQGKYDQAIPILEASLAHFREAAQQEGPGSLMYESHLIDEVRILPYLLESYFILAEHGNLFDISDRSQATKTQNYFYGNLLPNLVEAVHAYRAILTNTFRRHTFRLPHEFIRIYEYLYEWPALLSERADALEKREGGSTDVRVPLLRTFAELLAGICERLLKAKEFLEQMRASTFGRVEELVAALTSLQEYLTAFKQQTQVDIQSLLALEAKWPSEERDFLRGLIVFAMSISQHIDGESNLIAHTQTSARERLDNTWGPVLRLEEWINRWRTHLITDAEKIATQDQSQPFFINMIEFLVDMHNETEALVISEHARARAFIDLLEARDTIREQIHTTSVDHTNLPSPTTVPPVTLDEIRDTVKQHQSTTIEYFMSEQRLFIWVISLEGTIACHTLNLEQQYLKSKVNDLLELLQTDDISTERDISLANLLQEFHSYLIKSIQTHLSTLAKGEVITIIPYDVLFHIPFAALQNQQGHRLLEDFAIVYAPSIALLRYTMNNKQKIVHPSQPTLLALVNPAPFAGFLPSLDVLEEDFHFINDLYPDVQHNTLLFGSSATKEQLQSEATRHNVLCFATHAEAFDDDPLHSYLALARSHDDGLIRVPDIFSLSLYAHLVILLACETGRGQITGDGVIGLSRAFIWAGTSSLLLSLWPLPEEESMHQIFLFHSYWLRKGCTKAQALRMAQLHSMENYPQQPEVWASFMIIGEWQ